MTEDSRAPRTPQYIRHDTHYYEDGNVIFVVENTLFKLYKGLLARHSEVMRNMFNIGTSQVESQEKMDGVPTIPLTDSASEFSNLLDHVLSPSLPPYPPPTPSFEVIISLLKISSKYMFDGIRESAIWHLRQILPVTLDDFIRDPGLSMFSDARAAEIIKAVRDYDLPMEFLPLPLYAISTYSWGVSSVDAATQVYSALPDEDAARCMVARGRIYSEAMTMAFTMHEHGLFASLCNTPVSVTRPCARGRPSHLWVDPQEALAEFLRDPLLQLVIRKTCVFHALCRACSEAIQKKMAADLERLFHKLPEIFQLVPPTPDPDPPLFTPIVMTAQLPLE